MIIVATAITQNYIDKALPYLLSTKKLSYQADIVCITLGFDAPEYLRQLDHIKFLTMSKTDVKYLNINGCIQHGAFIDVLKDQYGAQEDDVVIFTDADIVVQTEFSNDQIKYLKDFDFLDVGVNWNVNEYYTLKHEHQILDPQIDLKILEKTLDFNAMRYKCFNTGVVVATVDTWDVIYHAYCYNYETIDSAYKHYAKQQWLLSYVFQKDMTVKIIPFSIHTHGHAGMPAHITWIDNVAYTADEPVVFAHKLTKPKKRIRLLYADTSGCVYYRMMLPFSKFALANENDYEVVGDFFKEEEDYKQYDILISQRGMNMQYFLKLKSLMRPDAKLVWDGDDDYFNVDEKNDIDGHFKRQEIIDGLTTFMRNSDALIVSTEYLKTLYGQYTDKPIYVLENCVDAHVWERHSQEKQEDGFIRIGWHGGSSHHKDFRQMVDVIVPTLKKYPFVKFSVVGWNCTAFKEFEDVKDQIEFTEWQPVTSEFGRNIVQFDIGIAPLEETVEFNKSKSAIKFLEYSMLGIPTIATDMEPYKMIQDGVTGYLVKTKEQWLEKLDLLINDAILRFEIGMNAFNFVKKNYDANKAHYRTTKIIEEILK